MSWRRELLRFVAAYAVALAAWSVLTPLFDRLLAWASDLVLPALDPYRLLESVSASGPEIHLGLRPTAGAGTTSIRFTGADVHFDVTTFAALFFGATRLGWRRSVARAAAAFPILLATQIATVFLRLEFGYTEHHLVPMAPGTAHMIQWVYAFFASLGILLFPVLLWAAFVLFATPAGDSGQGGR